MKLTLVFKQDNQIKSDVNVENNEENSKYVNKAENCESR